MALTDKHKAVCQEYIRNNFNSVDAYMSVYTHLKTTDKAKTQASRLLAKPEIKEYLEQLKKERMIRVNHDLDYVLNEVFSMANDDIKNYCEFGTKNFKEALRVDGRTVTDDFGNPVYETVTRFYLTLKESKDINTRNIKKIGIDKNGNPVIELYDRSKALELLGRHYGAWDKAEIDIADKVINNMLPVLSMISKAVEKNE